MILRQELHCHECNKYVQFDLDDEINGNHVLTCPVCKHEHYRVVKDGVISDRRWGQRNGDNNPTGYYSISASTTTFTSVSIDMSTNGGVTATGMAASYLRDAWSATTSAS